MIRIFREHPFVANILKLLVSASLLTALVLYIDLNALLSAFSQARPGYIALGIVLAAANVGIQFYRWRFLLRLVNAGISGKDALVSLLIGYSAGFFTPGQIGEYAGRILSLRSFKSTDIIMLSIVDKLYVAGTVITLGGIGLLLFSSLYTSFALNRLLIAAAALCMVLVAAVMITPDILSRFVRFLPGRIRKLLAPLRTIRDNFRIRHSLTMIFFTVLLFLVIVLQYHLFIQAFEPASLLTSAICVPSILLTKSFILPISIGDLGIRESAAVFFYTKAGLSAATAFYAALCIFFANIFLPSAVGAALVARIEFQKT